MTATEILQQEFGAEAVASEFRGQRRVAVPETKVFAALKSLKAHAFDLLVDITCVDYLHYPDARDRFGLVYLLTNTVSGERVTIRTFLNEPDITVPSVYSLWKGADWMEREVYDMYGVRFAGHPDLRRILMPSEYTAHPLRKDYPLRGHGERHNFPTVTRADS